MYNALLCKIEKISTPCDVLDVLSAIILAYFEEQINQEQFEELFETARNEYSYKTRFIWTE